MSNVFHTLITDRQQFRSITETYGEGSAEQRLQKERMYQHWRDALAQLFIHYREMPDDCGHIQHDILINAGILGIKGYHLQFILHCLRYAPTLLPEIILARIFPLWYQRTIVRKRSERLIEEKIRKTYCAPSVNKFGNTPQPIISVFVGRHIGGGLIDRLRGIVCNYVVSKQTNRDFRIHFVHPFPLTDYLVPATYDWRIPAEEVALNESADICVIDTRTNTIAERNQQRSRLTKAFTEKDPQRQLHVYSNANFCYDDDTFGSGFRELFRPAPRLQQRIDGITKRKYISVSARFLNLMGDFNEQNFSVPLPADEQQRLLSLCINALERIHALHPEDAILVCSDSVTFAEAARTKDYVFVIDGITTHIDNDAPDSYEHYEKTFLDFYALAGAQKSYLLEGSYLANSGFPYAASLVGSHAFEKFRIE